MGADVQFMNGVYRADRGAVQRIIRGKSQDLHAAAQSLEIVQFPRDAQAQDPRLPACDLRAIHARSVRRCRRGSTARPWV